LRIELREERSPLPRPNWSRPLPQPLKIPTVMTLKTLGDVRMLIERHLPAQCRAKDSWRHVAVELRKAANSGDPADVSVALQMVLSMEGVNAAITIGQFLQILGSACLLIVVLTHIAEAFHIFPAMGWGKPNSADHYLDLVTAILAATLLPLGFAADTLTRRKNSN
jgi:hypothetical protein